MQAPDLSPRSWIVPLKTVGREDLKWIGGKGVNLGELIRAGFMVPPGFVVTTAAYDLALDRSGLAHRITELPAGDSTDEQLGSAMRGSLLEAAIPTEVDEAIRAAYRAFGEGAVAIRSSATAEDLPEGTFAGQHDTFLNVIGAVAVLDAVRKCWASLWADRAIAYRQAAGLAHDTVKMAVIIQRMVPAEGAGVMFTASPVSGARDTIVIDASPGLGEAIVAGLVTPDHYEVHKPSLRITQQIIGRREAVIQARAGGGTERIETALPSGTPALPRATIREVALLGRTIEAYYGAPRDVEWAYADGKIYLLQARPITALPDTPVATRSRRALPANDQNFLADIFPMRPYPLDLSTHTRTLLQTVAEVMARPFGLTIPTEERSLETEDGVAVRLKGTRIGPTPRILYQPWLSLWQRRRYDVARWEEDPIIAEATQRARELEERNLRELSWGEILATFQEALALVPIIGRLRDRYLILAVRDSALFQLLLWLARSRSQFDALTAGVDNHTLAINRRLEELAALVRASEPLRTLFAAHEVAALPAALAAEPLAGDFLSAFEGFLRDYGHREFALILMSQPTWKDAPEVPLGIIRAFAASEAPSQMGGQSTWEQTRDAVLAGSPLLRKVFPRTFHRLLDRARRFSQFREDTHLLFMRPVPAQRRCAIELGRRLTEAGVLDQAEDVFHLTFDELESAGRPWPPPAEVASRLSAAVARRKAHRAALADEPFVPAAPTEVDSSDGALLRGTPSSAGIAEGPVCVVSGPSEFVKLKAGDILVAPFTSPSWTPLFRRAAAVIVDTGAAVSHAAIVAREYGIPAVMGTGQGTRALVDGQRVRVDGRRGLVFGV